MSNGGHVTRDPWTRTGRTSGLGLQHLGYLTVRTKPAWSDQVRKLGSSPKWTVLVIRGRSIGVKLDDPESIIKYETRHFEGLEVDGPRK